MTRQATTADPQAATRTQLRNIQTKTGERRTWLMEHLKLGCGGANVVALGPCEEAPKNSHISLRRKQQFAMAGPATKDSVEIGLNAKDLAPHTRLKVQPPGSLCQVATSAGVPAGATMPWSEPVSKPDRPTDSATVGMLGAAAKRLDLLMASAFRRPSFTG